MKDAALRNGEIRRIALDGTSKRKSGVKFFTPHERRFDL